MRIINDVLDFSKLEAGKLELDAGEFALHEVMDSLYDIFAQSVSEKRLEFFVSVDSSVPGRFKGDTLRLQQVLTNLVGNAVKFTAHGEIFVRAREVERSGDTSVLRFSVKDTGIGIEERQMRRLFSPFTQADESTTRKFGGTGLGLAIGKRLSEIMGGRLWGESAPGKGSEFHFEVPFERLSETPAEEFVLPSTFHGAPVLVVDDSGGARAFLSGMLREFGLAAVSAGSGQAGFKELERALGRREYALAIIDQRMPDMDGVQLAKKLGSHIALSSLPIVMMTDYGRESYLRKDDRDAKIGAFVFKPIKKDQLFDAVLSVLKREPSQDGEKRTALFFVTETASAMKGLDVLLVEDNDINQLVAAEILETAGARVVVAENGHKALKILFGEDDGRIQRRPRNFDVILMDVQMPEMDGLETTRRIRGRGIETPIVAVTAHSLKINRDSCKDAGMDEFISKPFEPNSLYEAIARQVGGDIKTSSDRGETFCSENSESGEA